MVKKILVTGGNGYIGARLCLYLASRGHRVTPVCYPTIPKDRVWIDKMENVLVGDVREESFLNELKEESFEVIVHLVSLDHRQSEGNPVLVSSINVVPVWNILNVFSKKNLEKFIYFSTVQVYGQLTTNKITENTRPKVRNAYGLTHLLGEDICDFYNRTTSVDCRVIRLSNSYGAPIFEENNCWWLVVNDLCRQAYHDKKIVLQSDGSPLRDFIHGWDVCQAVEKIMLTRNSDFLYHISSGETLTIGEIALCVQKICTNRYGIHIPIIRNGNSSLINQSNYQIDNSLLRGIGFCPKWSLDKGIGDLFNYMECNDKK